jgi:hypothetical protein
MSGKRRIDAVVRIRELQSRIAEAEAGRQRREVERRRLEADRALVALDERSALGREVRDVGSLIGHRRVLDGVVVEVNTSADGLRVARTDFDAAHAVWHDAHRKHDAVERLDERLRALDADEETRRVQAELDDLVVVRHGRAARNHLEER